MRLAKKTALAVAVAAALVGFAPAATASPNTPAASQAPASGGFDPFSMVSGLPIVGGMMSGGSSSSGGGFDPFSMVSGLPIVGNMMGGSDG